MSELDTSVVGEPPPPYMIFLVVFLFFITGLLGFLVCHLLKKKGYRCRTGDMECEEEEDEEKPRQSDDEDEDNQDTVEQILKCIIENEANMEAFKELLGNQNVCVQHDPRMLRKESLGGIPPHHHTVHSGSDRNSCHLCVQGRSKKNLRRSRTTRAKQRPREQTVFSVGRFRVIHTDKKLHGGPQPLADSGDQLDQSQDSEDRKAGVGDRKEGGYNLRNMFKDVRPPTESSNGGVPNTGKRRKSVTIFGLGRRGSDPSGVKTLTGGGGGKETAVVKFSQQPSVVMEEPLQADSLPKDPSLRPETGIKKEGSKAGSPKSPGLNLAPIKDQTSGPALETSPVAAQTLNIDSRSNSVLVSPSDLGLESGPKTESLTHPTARDVQAPVPSSLPIPTSLPSEQTFKSPACVTEREGEQKTGQVYSPGPLQTSTPINPGLGVVPGLSLSLAPPSPKSTSGAGLSRSFTPLGHSPISTSSPDLDPGIGASLASISLASSPTLSFPVNTPSPVSLVKTSTSPAARRQSLTPSQATKYTPTESAHSPSPVALSPHTVRTSAHSSSPHEGMTTVAPETLTEADVILTTVSDTTAITPATEEGGIVKTDRPRSVTGELKSSVLSVPFSDLPSKDRQSGSFPPSPGSPLSPSSPLGGRISSVTIVKARPDSKREFSVVTMLEAAESSASAAGKAEAQTGATSDQSAESLAKVGVHPTTSLGKECSKSGPTVSQEKDDHGGNVHCEKGEGKRWGDGGAGGD